MLLDDRSLIREQFGITYSSDPVNVYIPQAIPGQRADHAANQALNISV